MENSGIRRIAVSVYGGDQAFCNHAYGVIRAILGDAVEVFFFDSASQGCWNTSE